MGNTVYYCRTWKACLDNEADLKARYDLCEEIIGQLLDTMLNWGSNAGKEEYQLNDGQTIVRVKYRNPNEITSTIDALERIKNRIYFKLYGRVHVNQDIKVRGY